MIGSRLSGLCFGPLIAESYSTLHRSIGIGTALSIGRISGAIAPFVLYPIFLEDKWKPFLIYGYLSIIALVVIATYPVDLT